MNATLQMRLNEEFEEGIQLMEKAGYPEIRDNRYRVELNPRLKSTLGRCIHTSRNGKTYTIQLNQLYYEQASKDVRFNTIVHELCHSVPYARGDGHGARWKAVANRASKYLKVPITRCASMNEEKYKEVKDIRTDNAKYEVKCLGCGNKWEYYRKSKLITTYEQGGNINERFVCPICRKGNWEVSYK